MKLIKELIGHTWKSGNDSILICDENIDLLQSKGAQVFEKEEVKKPKKFKAIVEDDDKDTESAK